MQELKDILIQEIINNSNFIKATFSGIRRTSNNSWNKILIEPVIIKDKNMLQFNYFDTVKSITKNVEIEKFQTEINDVISCHFTSIYLRSNNYGKQIQITKKNKVLVKTHKNLDEVIVNKSHDKEKNRITSSKDNYLEMLGIASTDGKIKPNMHSKYKQIDEFIKIISRLTDWNEYKDQVNIIDCGVGNGYLTLATYNYFKNAISKNAHMEAIDIDAGAIERNNSKIKKLDWEDLHFETSNIISYDPIKKQDIDLTIALHACDTATDEALCLAIENQSKYILSVPCCHHDIQSQLKNNPSNNSIIKSEKHGILIERQGDIIADTLRYMLLEICGYSTNIIQYISNDHTSKNIMIRAEKHNDAVPEEKINEYKEFKSFWRVKPELEKLLTQKDIIKL